MRFFIALVPPPELQRDLWAAMGPVREREFPVRWVKPEGIHLTLKFLGDVTPERAGDLPHALVEAAAGMRSIALRVHGSGAFPEITRPRVVWAGVEPEPAIELLQDRVERVFAPLGFPTEARTFRPHLTLGRVTREARPRDFAGLDAALDAVAFEATALLDGVDLMRSELRRDGAVYHQVHRERLS